MAPVAIDHRRGHRHRAEAGRSCREGIRVEHDQVGRITDTEHQTPSRQGHRSEEGFLDGDRLFRMPRLAVIACPVHRRGNGDPGVQRCDGRIGPERENGACIEQGAQDEGPPRPARPVAIRDVAVVDRVFRLDARDNSELREPGDVDVIQ